MSIAISAPKTLPPAQRLVLHNVTWDEYELFCRALNEQHVRSAYAEGSLELMSPLHVHELYKELLGRFLVFLAFELNIPIKSGGSTTFRRRDLEKGLEPDTCYWIRNEPQVRGKKVIDLTVDPPPDIAIEIEITHTILDRISILQALGVAEIWRFDGVTIRVLVLRDGAYHEQQRSPSFPQVPLSKLVDFVHQAEQLDETTLLREFQAWIREQVACGWK